MKNKTYKLSIIMLALVFVISLAAFFGFNSIKADASGNVTVSGTNVFTAEGATTVRADKQGEGENEKYYTMFTLSDKEDSISYRRNLAYFWREKVTTGEGESATTTIKDGRFNMELGFKSLAFEKFVITFESQQYNKSKDSKSVNYIMFFPEGENSVKVLVTTDKDATKNDKNTSTSALDKDHITIKFGSKAGEGEVPVTVASGSTDYVSKFENVGGNYAKSSTSSTNPVYPLIFNAEFSEEENAAHKAEMVLYSINGQSFELGRDKQGTPSHNSEENYYYGGTVKDDTAPVLCLEEEISYFTAGEKFDFDYRVIDVLRSSPSDTKYFYVLKWKDFDEKKTDFENTKEDDKLFEEVTSDTFLESDTDIYLPAGDAVKDTEFANDKTLKADMAVKVYLKITDTTSNGESAEVFLDWYVKDKYLIKINGAEDKKFNFLAVAEDELGVTYNYDDGVNGFKPATDESGVVAKYQKKVDEAAKDLSAGSSSYLYLPSPEELFTDNATAYTDMKFSVYFYHNSQQSSTGLSSNNLSINVTQQGAYTFTIFAADAAGNDMYYLEKAEDGEKGDTQIGGVEYNYVKFGGGDVWTMFGDHEENGDYNRLPWFHFNVGYTGVSFEETPGKQSTAYVGTSYSSASFKINGISGSYDTVYRLFLFDRAAYYNDNKDKVQSTLTYDEFIEKMDAFFEGEERKYFKEIPVAGEVTEADEDFEELKAYNWSNTSTTFTPQVGNAFYMIRAEVTDKQYNTDPVTCSLAVAASVNAKTLKGEDDWLENNIASVVLLCIAGLAFIGIILLLVIKPKETGDIDEQFENVKSKGKKNKK